MTWVSIVLVGVGLADLVRSSATRRGAMSAYVLGPVTVFAVAALSGVFGWLDVLALAVACAGGAGWVVLSGRAQSSGRRPLWALTTLGLTLGGLLAFGGAASTPGGALARWLAWADLPGTTPASSARVLLVTGLALANLATANIVVRLVLLATGALRPDRRPGVPGRPGQSGPSVPQAADRLGGGRLLGPMERLVILGLGLAGEFAAAGLVIAAKGLLRFPEIQASARSVVGTGWLPGGPPSLHPSRHPSRHPGSGLVGIDEVTEYFLVGSFVSWLVALASLALAR